MYQEPGRALNPSIRVGRQLAEARPDAFLPDLAMSLNNLGLMLRDLGRREDALSATQEAVDHYRRAVDLAGREVRAGGEGEPQLTAALQIDDYTRWRLMEGLDDIGLTLRHVDDIFARQIDRLFSIEERRPAALAATGYVASSATLSAMRSTGAFSSSSTYARPAAPRSVGAQSMDMATCSQIRQTSRQRTLEGFTTTLARAAVISPMKLT